MKIIFLTLSLLLATPLWAAEDNRRVRPAEEADESRNEAATDDQVQSVLRLDNRSNEGLEVETEPDGTLRVDLEHRFTHALVVRIGPDGSRSIECVDSAAHVQELLKPRHQSSTDREEGQ